MFLQRVVLRSENVKMEIQRDFAYGICHSENLARDIGFVTHFRPKTWHTGIRKVMDFLHFKQSVLIALVFKIMKGGSFVYVELETRCTKQAQKGIAISMLAIPLT